MTNIFLDVSEGKVRAVKSWLEKGADVNVADSNGNFPLHLAAEKGFRGVCKVLLDAGANVNQKNAADGWTAVHLASIEGHTDVLRMLLAHNANLYMRDKEGYTAEYYADRFHNFDSLDVIQEFKQMRSESVSTFSQGSDSDRTLTDESDEDESSMMNWVIYGNVTKQPISAKRSRSKLKTLKSEDSTLYEEYSTNQPKTPPKKSSSRLDHTVEHHDITSQPPSLPIPSTGQIRTDCSESAPSGSPYPYRPPPPYHAAVHQAPPIPVNQPHQAHQTTSVTTKTYSKVAPPTPPSGQQVAPFCNVAGPPGSHPEVWSFSQSSATIPDDLMSLDDLDRDHSQTESEKVVLLKRLQCLVDDEHEEKENILGKKKDTLKRTEILLRTESQRLETKFQDILKTTIEQNRLELDALKRTQQEEEDRIQEEIDKLELEFKSLNSSSLLVSTLLNPTPVKDRGYFKKLDLEEEISCCSCQVLLRPPHKIYQCTNGDLFCSSCRGKPVCPACGVYLAQTIRNKALEKIAKKHF